MSFEPFDQTVSMPRTLLMDEAGFVPKQAQDHQIFEVSPKSLSRLLPILRENSGSMAYGSCWHVDDITEEVCRLSSTIPCHPRNLDICWKQSQDHLSRRYFELLLLGMLLQPIGYPSMCISICEAR